MRIIGILLLLFLSTQDSFTQICPPEQNTLVVKITTDRFGRETSWILSSADSIYGSVDKNVYNGVGIDTQTFCIPASECLTFTIFDGFGDGIADGGYELILNEELLAANNTFGRSEAIEINCPIGTTCSQALPITEGQYIAPQPNTWYVFTPDTIGTFEISTCDNTCDTRIWVYDRCESALPGDNEGFIFFNEDACGRQAKVNALLDAGASYLIRISHKNNNCSNQAINWGINYKGPIIGCTNPNSCNYNPLASMDDGTCIEQGDPNCPNGPDLSIRQDILRSSFVVDSIDNTDECFINEGCLKGYGMREIIRFTTRFENIGEQDFFIGKPTEDSNQFTYDNCHNHFHYDNYAEYLFYDVANNRLPAGFKSGFCLEDLGCGTGITKYNCNNMGLSVGCFDEYLYTLDCQWIDVTDYPDGNYTFVARINWQNQPDLIGRVEKSIDNNWSQACLILDRSSGKLEVMVQADCPVFVDCEGTLYGSVEKDCNGVCGGNTLAGDTNADQLQDMQDVDAYLSMIVDGEMQATPCNDLNGDAALTIYDAALLADCLNFGQAHQHQEQGLHDHCNFPAGISNNLDTAEVQLISHDVANKTLDLSIRNSASIVGFQFQMSGISIQSVEQLTSNFRVQVNIKEALVVGLALDGTTIDPSRDHQAFLRIHYLEIMEPLICIESIADMVDANYQKVVTAIQGPCIESMLTTTAAVDLSTFVRVQPNPFSSSTRISFPNPNGDRFRLDVFDGVGRLQTAYGDIKGNSFELISSDLSSGLYFFSLKSTTAQMQGKFLIR